jgi:hypothetical protein
MKIKVLIALSFISCSYLGAQMSELRIPNGVGVNIHFTRGHEADLDMIKNAGFKYVRMDFSWSETEKTMGEYDWSAYDELTKNLEQRGLSAIYILDYSNRLYEQEHVVLENGKQTKYIAAPASTKSMDAFAQWAAAAARHFKGKRIVWEIWNEPNISVFWKPEPNVDAYSRLAKLTIRAIKAVDPQSLIIAPATSEFPWQFFESFFKETGLHGLDAISVHPYRSLPPETVEGDYVKLKALIERYKPASKAMLPIISGEWGYATHARGISLDTQASYIVRQQLINLNYGVPISIWYDWKNDGTDTNYNEHNFGTVFHDLLPKPAYVALSNMCLSLSGYKILHRLVTANTNDFILLMERDLFDQAIAAWTVSDPHNLLLDVDINSDTQIDCYDIFNRAVTITVLEKKLNIPLNQTPVIIKTRQHTPFIRAASLWAIDESTGVIVVAGKTNKNNLKFKLKNPNPYTARVVISCSDDINSIEHEYLISSNSIKTVEFPLIITRRDIEMPLLTFAMRYESVHDNNKEIMNDKINWRCVLANPIRFTIAPVAEGVIVIAEDREKTGFNGYIDYHGKKTVIQISEQVGMTNIVLRGTDPAAEKASIKVLDDHGNMVGLLKNQRFERIRLTNVAAVLDGDTNVRAFANLNVINQTEVLGEIRTNIWLLDYSFEKGWRFIRCTCKSELAKIEGQPIGYGVWVKGDASGNIIRMRFTDATGQVFQPSGFTIDWKEWRWVVFDFKGPMAHWGGSNDGRINWPIKLDTLLLIDSIKNQNSGKIEFCNPAFIYAEAK